MKVKILILFVIIIAVLVSSGCISGDRSYSYPNNGHCFSISNGSLEPYESWCNQKCVDRGYIPGNHKKWGSNENAMFDCICCEGDVNTLGCRYETANLFMTMSQDMALMKSDCKETCEGYEFTLGNPERVNPGGTWLWDCNCYKCSEDVTTSGYKSCYYDVIEKRLTHCFRPDGSKVVFGNEESGDKLKCKPNWKCSVWSDCSSSGIQTRSCQDQNNCGMNENNPPENQNCVPKNVSTNLTLYDDFSGSSLNITKWEESMDPTYPTNHYLDTSEGKFHIIQDIRRDSDYVLKMTRKLNPGEILQYEVYYSFGDGNRIHRIKFNGKGIQDLISCSNCGAIGFWNTEASAGNQIGLYSLKYEFYENQIKATVIRPDESVWTETFDTNSLTKPYEIWLATGTGNNGLIDVYFDNFYIG